MLYSNKHIKIKSVDDPIVGIVNHKTSQWVFISTPSTVTTVFEFYCRIKMLDKLDQKGMSIKNSNNSAKVRNAYLFASSNIVKTPNFQV